MKLTSLLVGTQWLADHLDGSRPAAWCTSRLTGLDSCSDGYGGQRLPGGPTG